jgi:ribosomal protein S18 acetylase RimI-like enzyme
MYQITELTTKEQMLEQLPIIQQLYPEFTLEIYESLLLQMIPHNYKQLIVTLEDKTIGLSGFWIGVKLWCGRYLELDNVIVHPDFRSKGIGSLLTNTLNDIAIANDCNMMALDAYTTNFGAQKFYFNHGFVPKGFHFVKYLKEL